MRLLRWVLGLLLVSLVLASCSATDSSSGGGGAPAPMEEDRADAGGAGAGDGVDEGADGDAGGDADDGSGAPREVITTGHVWIVVEDARRAADEATRIVEAAGGRIDAREEYTGQADGDPSSARLTVRVPSSDLTATLDDLEALGEIENLSLSAQDVTRESQDLDARIRALEASTDRLLDLMVDAETSADLLAAESALSERQAELESLQSRRSALSDQVALATLEISLDSERAPAQLEPGGFVGGLQSGWDSLVSFASGVLVVLGVLLPWLAVLTVVGALALPLVRRRRRPRVGTSRAAAPSPGADADHPPREADDSPPTSGSAPTRA